MGSGTGEGGGGEVGEGLGRRGKGAESIGVFNGRGSGRGWEEGRVGKVLKSRLFV